MAASLPILFRMLASRASRLIGGYAICVTLAVLARQFATVHELPVVAGLGGLLALVAFSVLFTVFALYRDDPVLLTGVFLTIIIGASTVIALAIESVVETGSLGPAIMLAVVGPFQYFVLGLILIPGFAGAVWVARRLRRFLAPATLESPDDAA